MCACICAYDACVGSGCSGPHWYVAACPPGCKDCEYTNNKVTCKSLGCMSGYTYSTAKLTCISEYDIHCLVNRGGHEDVTLSLLSNRWHHVDVTLSLLSSRWHHIDVTLSLLSSRWHHIDVTLSLLSNRWHHIDVTLSLLSNRWHHIDVTLSLLSNRWHHIDVTLSLLSSRWHHIVTRWRHMTWPNFLTPLHAVLLSLL